MRGLSAYPGKAFLLEKPPRGWKLSAPPRNSPDFNRPLLKFGYFLSATEVYTMEDTHSAQARYRALVNMVSLGQRDDVPVGADDKDKPAEERSQYSSQPKNPYQYR